MSKKYALAVAFAMVSIFSFGQITFTDATSTLEIAPVFSDHAIGVADMNGDGKDDIIQAHDGETITYALQNEPGEPFTVVEVETMTVPNIGSANLWGMCVGDLDNNGINDFIGGGYYNGIYLITSDADGDFETEVIAYDELFVQGINTFDIDNDGFLDVFACNDHGLSPIYIREEEDFYEEDYSILNPVSDEESDNSGNYGSVFTDIDNNGHCDLYIAKCRQGVTDPEDPRRVNLAFMNDGELNWLSEGIDRNIDSGAQSWVGVFGDIDNDGDLDLFLGQHDVQSQLFLNDGNGYFTEITEDSGLSGAFPLLAIQAAFEDIDNDTYVDLIVSGGDNCYVAFNNGDGTFAVTEDLLSGETNSFALGDLNSDGFVDVFTSGGGYGGWNNSEDDQAFLNDANNTNAYVNVELQGVASNINGIGSRITLEGPWGTMVRDVRSGMSYGIQNSLIQHFGLGANDMIDQITVTWPSGTVDTYTDISGNQQITIVEGEDLIQSIEDLGGQLQHLTLFPNPTAEFIQIDLEDTNINNATIIVFDMMGKKVLTQNVVNKISRIDVSDFSNGQYTYQLISEGVVEFSGNFVKESR